MFIGEIYVMAFRESINKGLLERLIGILYARSVKETINRIRSPAKASKHLSVSPGQPLSDPSLEVGTKSTLRSMYGVQERQSYI